MTTRIGTRRRAAIAAGLVVLGLAATSVYALAATDSDGTVSKGAVQVHSFTDHGQSVGCEGDVCFGASPTTHTVRTPGDAASYTVQVRSSFSAAASAGDRARVWLNRRVGDGAVSMARPGMYVIQGTGRSDTRTTEWILTGIPANTNVHLAKRIEVDNLDGDDRYRAAYRRALLTVEVRPE